MSRQVMIPFRQPFRRQSAFTPGADEKKVEKDLKKQFFFWRIEKLL